MRSLPLAGLVATFFFAVLPSARAAHFAGTLIVTMGTVTGPANAPPGAAHRFLFEAANSLYEVDMTAAPRPWPRVTQVQRVLLFVLPYYGLRGAVRTPSLFFFFQTKRG